MGEKIGLALMMVGTIFVGISLGVALSPVSPAVKFAFPVVSFVLLIVGWIIRG